MKVKDRMNSKERECYESEMVSCAPVNDGDIGAKALRLNYQKHCAEDFL
jgi:hypothetical protein